MFPESRQKRIRWTAAEWGNVSRTMVTLYPEKDFVCGAPDITAKELSKAMHQAIDPLRHRTFCYKFLQLASRRVAQLAKTAPKSSPKNPIYTGSIRSWTASDYLVVARALVDLRPDLYLAYEDMPTQFNQKDFDAAQEVLPKTKRCANLNRTYLALKLREYFGMLRAARPVSDSSPLTGKGKSRVSRYAEALPHHTKKIFAMELMPPNHVQASAPPPRPTPNPVSNLPPAPAVAKDVARMDALRGKKWSAEEVRAVARELHALLPHLDFSQPAHQKQILSMHFIAAQNRALPADRHRIGNAVGVRFHRTRRRFLSNYFRHLGNRESDVAAVHQLARPAPKTIAPTPIVAPRPAPNQNALGIPLSAQQIQLIAHAVAEELIRRQGQPGATSSGASLPKGVRGFRAAPSKLTRREIDWQCAHMRQLVLRGKRQSSC